MDDAKLRKALLSMVNYLSAWQIFFFFFLSSTCRLVKAGHQSESARQLDSWWDGFYFGRTFSEKSHLNYYLVSSCTTEMANRHS